LIEEKKIGYSGNGLYGWETVQPGWPGDGAPDEFPVLQHQVIAEIATKVSNYPTNSNGGVY
jgi:hypothetical protein